MKKLNWLLFAFFIVQSALSQTKTVAVMPFVSASPEYRSRASQLQDIVVASLSKKSDIILVDRSKDTLLLRELDNQIREQSMAAQNLVQQGKVLGAQNMITGTLSNVSVTQDTKTTTGTNFITHKPTTNTTTTYDANIAFSLQLLDVETGRIISQRSFNSNDKTGGFFHFDLSGGTTGSSREDAIANAMSARQKQILAWINECYPPDIRILKIDERDKKGYPATILITGVDASLAVGTRLDLNEKEVLDAGDGKQLTRLRPIGALKITDKQGDITVCKVTDGEKVLEDKMKSNAKLQVAIK